MKKTFLNVFAICVFSTAAFAGGSDSPGITCVDGGSDSPGVKICQPVGGETGHGNRPAKDDSAATIFIKTLIAEFNPFVFFIN